YRLRPHSPRVCTDGMPGPPSRIQEHRPNVAVRVLLTYHDAPPRGSRSSRPRLPVSPLRDGVAGPLPRFRANEVRLPLGVIAYNLGNLLRRLVLPAAIQSWSLVCLSNGGSRRAAASSRIPGPSFGKLSGASSGSGGIGPDRADGADGERDGVRGGVLEEDHSGGQASGR